MRMYDMILYTPGTKYPTYEVSVLCVDRSTAARTLVKQTGGLRMGADTLPTVSKKTEVVSRVTRTYAALLPRSPQHQQLCGLAIVSGWGGINAVVRLVSISLLLLLLRRC